MLQGIFTNQLALGCAQAAATTLLALVVTLIARGREIHLERETIVALIRGIIQIIAVGSVLVLLLRGPKWTSVLLLAAMMVAAALTLDQVRFLSKMASATDALLPACKDPPDPRFTGNSRTTMLPLVTRAAVAVRCIRVACVPSTATPCASGLGSRRWYSPEAFIIHACRQSRRLMSRISQSCCRNDSATTGVTTSTRHDRFRSIQSAEPM